MAQYSLFVLNTC